VFDENGNFTYLPLTTHMKKLIEESGGGFVGVEWVWSGCGVGVECVVEWVWSGCGVGVEWVWSGSKNTKSKRESNTAGSAQTKPMQHT